MNSDNYKEYTKKRLESFLKAEVTCSETPDSRVRYTWFKNSATQQVYPELFPHLTPSKGLNTTAETVTLTLHYRDMLTPYFSILKASDLNEAGNELKVHSTGQILISKDSNGFQHLFGNGNLISYNFGKTELSNKELFLSICASTQDNLKAVRRRLNWYLYPEI